jgi:hypothetical protein
MTHSASIIAAGALAVLLLVWFVVKAAIGHLVAVKIFEMARRRRHARGEKTPPDGPDRLEHLLQRLLDRLQQRRKHRDENDRTGD